MISGNEKPVLVVEDSATMRHIISALLNQIGFPDVDEAENGEKGYEMACEKEYSFIVSDWAMGPVDGLELLGQLRTDDVLKDIPFIMISSISRADDVMRAKEAGVDAYIVKPFDAQVLQEKIDGISRRH